MKTIRNLAVTFTLLGAAALAHAQINMPNPTEPGSSIITAVRLVVTSDLMVDRSIRRWIRTHYPGWSPDPHEFQTLGDERYAVVYMTHPDNPGRRVYFRIVRSHNDPDESSPFPSM